MEHSPLSPSPPSTMPRTTRLFPAATLLLLTLLLQTLLPPTHALGRNTYCGVALSTGHHHHRYWDLSPHHGILTQIRATGTNTIQLSAYIRQVTPTATKARPETDPRALEFAIRRIHEAGLKVFLKPVVEVEDKDGDYIWRGRIPGSKSWFKRVYQPYIVSMARLAQRTGVEVFAVGSELRESINKQSRWIQTIGMVRSVYSGKVTYVANHDSYKKVQFWYKLDFVSISAYFRMAKKDDPVPNWEQTHELLRVRAQRVSRFLSERGLKEKGVLVAEVGFQSKAGIINYFVPWAWTAEGKISNSAQAKMYDAFLSNFLAKPWSLGALMWHWEFDRNAGYTYAKGGYTPQNKPAAAIMAKKFKKYC